MNSNHHWLSSFNHYCFLTYILSVFLSYVNNHYSNKKLCRTIICRVVKINQSNNTSLYSLVHFTNFVKIENGI